MRLTWLLACGSAVTVGAGFLAPRPASTPFPEGYREWAHIKSSPIAAGRPVHHIYANEKALAGYRSGHFPDGAVIVFDVFSVTTTGDVAVQGSRLRVDVMRKDAAGFPEGGGWDFEEFQGDGREPSLNAQGRAGCVQCHSKQKDRDFVYSQLPE